MENQTEGKTLAWTEEAKFQFLLRIVAQLKEDGKSINWQRLNMPGRTTKSLQNMWTKINKAVADLDEASGSGTTSPAKTPTKRTPTPRKTPTKKPKPAEDDGDDNDDDSFGSPKSTPKKRSAAFKGTPRKTKKVKRDADSEEENSCDGLMEPKAEPDE